MAKAPKREAEAEREKDTDPQTPLERMRELTRRVVNVPRDEVPTAKKPAKGSHG